MSTTVRRSTHLSRHLQFLRERRGLRPGQLAVALGASNPSKVGSLIRAFEQCEPPGDHWLGKLAVVLQPTPTDLGRCLELDQIQAAEKLERDRLAWEAWTDERIEPFLPNSLKADSYGVQEAPRLLHHSRH